MTSPLLGSYRSIKPVGQNGNVTLGPGTRLLLEIFWYIFFTSKTVLVFIGTFSGLCLLVGYFCASFYVQGLLQNLCGICPLPPCIKCAIRLTYNDTLVSIHVLTSKKPLENLKGCWCEGFAYLLYVFAAYVVLPAKFPMILKMLKIIAQIGYSFQSAFVRNNCTYRDPFLLCIVSSK